MGSYLQFIHPDG